MTEGARRRVADQLREIADRMVGDEIGLDSLADIEAALAAAQAAFPPSDPRRSRAVLLSRAEPEDAAAFAAHALTVGTAPTYPPLTIEIDGDRIVADLSFGPAWEGPAGTVHGGFLAAAFDIVLSQLAVQHLGQCVTRTLRMRYLRPTPLHTPLRIEAEVTEQAGRLLDLTARLTVDDRLTTRAHAQFASVSHRP